MELWDDPECHFGLAQRALADAPPPAEKKYLFGGGGGGNATATAVFHLERAAETGHAYAAFNLGLAHLFGHAGTVDGALAAAWFEASGLPEGLAAAAAYHAGDRGAALRGRAERLGVGAQWRAVARYRTGSGGTGNVDLHAAWPRPTC